MAKTVNFYFEFASPYSYLASIDIDERVERAGGHVEWSPIDLPRIWKANGVLDAYLSIRKLKMPYIRQDAARCANLAGIKLESPGTPATDTSLAKRTYWGLIEAQDDRAKPFLKHVWQRYFVSGLPIMTLDDIAAAASPLDLDVEQITKFAAQPKSIARHEASNAAAIASGCFGVPWFVSDGECFFGHDRISQLTNWLTKLPDTPFSRAS